MIYCQAVLTKAGLGGRLFSWARCRFFSNVNKVPMLSPLWTQLKIGPLLRGEPDPRFYNNLFKKRQGDISGMKRAWLEWTAKIEHEPDNLNCLEKTRTSKDTIILFKDWGGYFRKLNGWDEMLYGEIYSITKEVWLKRADSIQEVPIGIHIRRGDFKEAKSAEDFHSTGALRTPLGWFIESLEVIRRAVGFSAKAVVVSNGREEELKELLKLENVTLVRGGSAISDLLILSKAKVLIASGGSTFSCWASFFGQMPTISYPGQSLTWYNLANRKGFYIGEFDPDSPSTQFIEQARAVLRS